MKCTNLFLAFTKLTSYQAGLILKQLAIVFISETSGKFSQN